MPTEDENRRRIQDDLARTRRELGAYADYAGPWRICLFRCEPGDDDFMLQSLDVADPADDDARTAAEAAAELRTTVLFETAPTEQISAGSVLATPILDPLITDPSPLQQFVLGVVTFASGVPVATWTERYEFQMIAN